MKKYAIAMAVLAVVSIAAYSNTGAQETASPHCAEDDPMRLTNFIKNWNKLQKPKPDDWIIDSSPKTTERHDGSIQRCGDNKSACLRIKYVGNCIVHAVVGGKSVNYTSTDDVFFGVQRLVLWTKLIKSLEPGLSEAERKILDTSLHKGLTLEGPEVTTSAKTDVIEYIVHDNRKQIFLIATPIALQ